MFHDSHHLHDSWCHFSHHLWRLLLLHRALEDRLLSLGEVVETLKAANAASRETLAGLRRRFPEVEAYLVDNQASAADEETQPPRLLLEC